MALRPMVRLLRPLKLASVSTITQGRLPHILGSWQRGCAMFDPPYINPKPEIPLYPTLNIRMRGYDYAQLESFLKYAHHLLRSLQAEPMHWPVPARTCKIQTYMPNTSIVQHEYDLSTFERVLQVQDLPSTKLPIILEFLQKSLPEGVEFTVKEAEEEEDEFRYVPDMMFMELQDEMDQLNELREARRKK